ncbi:UNVERIFIED_CONTAM: hypothetical protein GTU68_032819 [Idotea baltica]|nr:hypothetical protein [Idotea baltica]
MSNPVLHSVVQVADDHLILGHRLSEWCGHAPLLEEDLSMPNMALDLIGTARTLYSYAANLENKGRTEDDFAYLRTDREYQNCLLVERPNTDFAHTMLKQLYFSAFMKPFWESMHHSTDATLQALSHKAVKEIAYHIRHSGEWIVRLGDGTTESASRMSAAVCSLHLYTDELFEMDEQRLASVEQGVFPELNKVKTQWLHTIDTVFAQAKLTQPEVSFSQTGGRQGLHTEDFGMLLAQLQYLPRSYPGATW